MSWNPVRQTYAFALARVITIEAVLKAHYRREGQRGAIVKTLDGGRSVSMPPPMLFLASEKRDRPVEKP